jgi:hypothetical protein
MNKHVRAHTRERTRAAKFCGIVLALVLAALFAGTARAYYAHGGRGSGSASVTTMNAPTGVEAAAGAGTVALSWHAVSPPSAETVSYYVSRDGTPIGGSCGDPASPINSTSCSDSGLGKGSYSYRVTAVWRSWTATSSPTAVALSSGAAAQIVLSGSTGDLASGSTRALTATVEDSSGNTVSSGPDSEIDIGFEQQSGTGSVSGTGSTAASAGVATSTVTGVLAGAVDITATGTLSGPGSTRSNTLSFNVELSPADASQSTLTPASSSITANGTASQVLTVQAKDSNGNDETSGGDTVTITEQSGTGTVGPVTDNGDGTYTATVTAPTASGSGTFVATLDGNPVDSGSATQTQATVTYLPGPALGIVLSDETLDPSPDVSCSGPVGSITCTSDGESNTTGTTLTAKLTLVDQFGNPVDNTGPSIGIDIGMSGDGSVDPSGAGALTISTGASTTSSSFTIARHNGNDKMLTMTASVHGTSQTLTIILSSGSPPGSGEPVPANTQTTPTPTQQAATTEEASQGAASEGPSSMREVVFTAVLGASVLGLVALLTMPIPRRRRAGRRRAG